MSQPVLELRRADASGVDEVLAILDSAASWLRAEGIEQWPQRFTALHVLPSIVRGNTWLAELDGRPAGTITVDWADPLWASRHDNAGYVHRLAALRSSPGLGLRLLEWAGEAVRTRGRRFVRLDCVASNPRLRTYYETAGFAHRGDVAVTPSAPPSKEGAAPVLHSLYELELPGRLGG